MPEPTPPRPASPHAPVRAETQFHPHRRRGTDPAWPVRLYNRGLLLLLVYVLSTGPAYWLVYDAQNISGSLGHKLVYYLYLPIIIACEFEPIAVWFNWYVSLWVL
jgi:hypothetical protein